MRSVSACICPFLAVVRHLEPTLAQEYIPRYNLMTAIAYFVVVWHTLK
jgi:hypothetical protein